jgi:hypothetical protein
MNNFPLTEALVRLRLAERYDEASYTRAVNRLARPRRRRRRGHDLPDSSV